MLRATQQHSGQDSKRMVALNVGFHMTYNFCVDIKPCSTLACDAVRLVVAARRAAQDAPALVRHRRMLKEALQKRRLILPCTENLVTHRTESDAEWQMLSAHAMTSTLCASLQACEHRAITTFGLRLHLPGERAQRRAAHVPCQLRVLKQPVVIRQQHQCTGLVLDDALRTVKIRVDEMRFSLREGGIALGFAVRPDVKCLSEHDTVVYRLTTPQRPQQSPGACAPVGERQRAWLMRSCCCRQQRRIWSSGRACGTGSDSASWYSDRFWNIRYLQQQGLPMCPPPTFARGGSSDGHVQYSS